LKAQQSDVSDAIVQFFDQPFDKVAKALPRLAKLGVGFALISPPQKSHSSHCWWGRYQPVDFSIIDGPLGDQNSLQRLCSTANSLGVRVVADAVLHHLSNEGRYLQIRAGRLVRADYPRFGLQDLRPGRAIFGRGRPLPELDPASPWVQEQLRNYLRMLYSLGVRGFRFDAAKHMPAYLFEKVLQGLPPTLCFGEMVHAHPSEYSSEHLRWMKGYDFPLARQVKLAFSSGGDLRSLSNPTLWGPTAINFVNCHDFVKRARDFSFFRLSDRRDRQLASAYVLARQDGQPLIYSGDLRQREVKFGLAFHRDCLGLPERWVWSDRNQIAILRGHQHLALINKAGSRWSLEQIHTGLRPGTYHDGISGAAIKIERDGRLTGLWLAPRSAALLVRVSD
jgi:alpha-amylase